jgi:hypothetical protein
VGGLDDDAGEMKVGTMEMRMGRRGIASVVIAERVVGLGRGGVVEADGRASCSIDKRRLIVEVLLHCYYL